MSWIRSVMTGRRSLENPSLDLNDPDAWVDTFGGGTAASGVRVNARVAITLSTMFRGVTLRADYIAKTPLRVIDTATNKPDLTHPAHRLLRRKANSEMLAIHFKRTLAAHAIWLGGGFAYIDRDGDGRPRELWQLRPDRTYPIRRGGRLMFLTSIGGDYGDGNADQRLLLPENVLHIHGLGYDGLTGYSLLEIAAESIGNAIAKQRFGGAFFANAANPSVIIKHPKKMSDGAVERLKRGWGIDSGLGLTQAHRPKLIADYLEVEKLSINARDSQLTEGLELDTQTIANFVKLPGYLLGVKGQNSYNSLEAQRQDLLDHSIDPDFCDWEQECDDKLLTEDEKRRESRECQFNRGALVRVDMAKRFGSYRTALGGAAFMAPDEVRAFENLPPAGLTDVPQPLNMTPAKPGGKDDPQADDTADSDEAREALRELLADAFGRMARRLTAATAKRSRRAQPVTDGADWYAEHGATISRSIAPALRVAGRHADDSQLARRLCDDFAGHLADWDSLGIDMRTARLQEFETEYADGLATELIDDV